MLRGKVRKKGKEVNLTLNANLGIHNKFDIEVRDAITGELKQRAQAFNVVCNSFWTRFFGQNSASFNYILYGSGSGTPSVADTELFTRINGLQCSSSRVVNADFAQGWVSTRKYITIGVDVSTDETITEVGIGYDATHIITHAMLQDMNGNPISITKAATDVITIYATLYLHWNPNGFSSGKIQLVSDFYGYGTRDRYGNPIGTNGDILLSLLSDGSTMARVNLVLLYGFVVMSASRSPAPTGSFTKNSIYWTKDASTKTLTLPTTRIGVDNGNFEIRSIILHNGTSGVAEGPFVVIDASVFGFSNFAITGEAVGTGDGSTTEFSTAFSVNSGAKVYIDGVETQTATVRTGPKSITAPDAYLRPIDQNGDPVWAPLSIPTRTLPLLLENFSGKPLASLAFAGANSPRANVYVSNDLTTWVQIATDIGSSSVNIPTQYQSYRYFKVEFAASTGGGSALDVASVTQADAVANNIVFSTPPAAGAVITADYIPDCIPKDSNHVFDFSATITMGDYTGS